VHRLPLQGIFLSYRREDTAPYARLLQVELSERIPDAHIFMDLDSIEAGLDFAEVIRRALDSCAVLVALIGRQWAAVADEEGRRRLDNPDDLVRFEVQTALEGGVRVIPVLVDGAKPLRQEQLPSELGKLARLNAYELSYGRYQYDADRLADLIQQLLAAAANLEEPLARSPTSSGADINAKTFGGGRRPDPERMSWIGSLRLRWRTLRQPYRRSIQAAATGILLVAALATVLITYPRPEPASHAWTALQPLPEPPLEAAGVAEYDGRLWVVGGVSARAGRAKLDAVHVYDPGTRTWHDGPRLPEPLSHAALVSTGESLYLLGGLAKSGSVASVYRLDSPTSKWVKDVPLPAARGAGAASWDGSRIIFAGGVGTDGRAKSDVWALEGGRWRTIGSLSRPREKLASATDGFGTVWFIGGRDPNLEQTAFGDVDIVQASSVKPAHGIAPVAGAAAVWWPGAGICVLGGQTEAGFSRAVSCLGGAATRAPPELNSGRAGLGAAVLGGSVYVVGGYDAGHHGSSSVEAEATGARA
jgi:TIR domain/Kelch motif